MARGRDFDSAGAELRKRLAELNRKYASSGKPAVMTADQLCRKAPAAPKARTSASPLAQTVKPQPVVYHRDLPRVEVYSPKQRSVVHVDLEVEVEGEEWRHQQWGKAFAVRTQTNTLDGAVSLSRRFEEKIDTQCPTIFDRIHKRTGLKEVQVEDFVFMDIETTGLGNSPVFLIGVMIWLDGQFEVQQYLARNYAEERAILAFFIEECTRRKLLVTFNGKSFDFPFLRTRCAATGVPFVLEIEHLDLLHVGRAIWKDILPNCKLQTLEHYVCERVRHGDIPGSEIPDAYHAYVRSKNAYQIVEVLKHNLLDLVTLADIMTHLPPMPEETKRRRRRKKQD